MISLSPQANVRAQAREALRGQWVQAVIAFVILLLPLSLIDGMCTAIICAVVSLIADETAQMVTAGLIIYPLMLAAGYLLSPLFNGYIRMYYRNGVDGRMDIRDLIYFFDRGRYVRALRFNLSFAVRMALPFLLFFSPVVAYSLICSRMSSDFVDSVLYADCYFILCVLSAILVAIYSLKYLFAFIAFSENTELSNSEIFHNAKQINRLYSGSAVKLLFSYAPWILLCMTILPILYVGPYLTQGMCIGAKWMTRAYHDRMGYRNPPQEVNYESIAMHDRL